MNSEVSPPAISVRSAGALCEHRSPPREEGKRAAYAAFFLNSPSWLGRHELTSPTLSREKAMPWLPNDGS
jgi:hypothetical protein